MNSDKPTKDAQKNQINKEAVIVWTFGGLLVAIIWAVAIGTIIGKM